MRYLLDTNVISEAVRPTPDSNVLSWLVQHSSMAAISAVTLGEMWKGILCLESGKRKEAYETWFKNTEIEFSKRILPIDAEVMKQWGNYHAEQRKVGRKLQNFDSLIAATALHFDLVIATRNEKDFHDVPTINPWNWGN